MDLYFQPENPQAFHHLPKPQFYTNLHNQEESTTVLDWRDG